MSRIDVPAREDTLQAYRAPNPRRPRIAVVGSINLDIVVSCSRLPNPGETVAASRVSRIPGGKGANQALACARLGADVTLISAIGRDDVAEEALRNLGEVSQRLQRTNTTTGQAFIMVGDDGENFIAVVPGANEKLTEIDLPPVDAVLCQLEVPDSAIVSAYRARSGLFCLNASPSRSTLPVVPDLTIVNEAEYQALGGLDGYVAVTYGARGAALFFDGEELARSAPPAVIARDGTAAGDAFAACLVVSILQGYSATDAIRRSCAAGAIAASRFGAQTSLPVVAEIDSILETSEVPGHFGC